MMPSIEINLPEFKERRLEFLDDRIVQHWPDYWLESPIAMLSPWGDGPLPEVMMSWEDHLMKRHAEVVCENGGDILEIGFGMGISATYIQEQNPKSHTIVEIHPQVLERLDIWAKDKSNVIVVRGDWHKKFQRGKLGKYDGIFYDGFGDDNYLEIGRNIKQLSKPGAIFTFWNNLPEEANVYGLEGATYEKLPARLLENGYFTGDSYYLPKVVI